MSRVVARGPGRVNLIGEHTDYNDGLALPFAIDRGVTVTAEPLPHGDRIEARALDVGEADAFDLEGVGGDSVASGWRAFVRGTVAELRTAGHTVRPCRLTIEGDVPLGSGLSSSAALEAALCLALLEDDDVDRVELAKLCSRVENDHVGARTGLLDQLAVLCGEEGHALRIDFRDLAIEPVPLDLGAWRLVTLESGASHEHAGGGYNERRAECAAACEALGIASLRDATSTEGLPAPLDRRVRHVLSENARVDAMAEALAAGDLQRAGALLRESHESLRDDYEASVPEVERAVAAVEDAGAAGARMVGGGFGGSVLALFPPGATPPDGSVSVAPGPAARRL
ncbi:MAG TPA: galactokinase [Solirubrobacteraceae bacterium]|nr:galactokinase [Solirubrobacteraceae bacterium]